jgi:hypothetical protein
MSEVIANRVRHPLQGICDGLHITTIPGSPGCAQRAAPGNQINFLGQLVPTLGRADALSSFSIMQPISDNNLGQRSAETLKIAGDC